MIIQFKDVIINLKYVTSINKAGTHFISVRYATQPTYYETLEFDTEEQRNHAFYVLGLALENRYPGMNLSYLKTKERT